MYFILIFIISLSFLKEWERVKGSDQIILLNISFICHHDLFDQVLKFLPGSENLSVSKNFQCISLQLLDVFPPVKGQEMNMHISAITFYIVIYWIPTIFYIWSPNLHKDLYLVLCG